MRSRLCRLRLCEEHDDGHEVAARSDIGRLRIVPPDILRQQSAQAHGPGLRIVFYYLLLSLFATFSLFSIAVITTDSG